MISDFHALKTSLALVHGIALGRWSQGLCVMLEKVMGNKLINKLRAPILLMEADFNATNKIIYGERMLDNARKYKLSPDEIYSEKQRMADGSAVSKILFYDVVRQLKRPAGLASVDAAYCYDRVAHAIVKYFEPDRQFTASQPFQYLIISKMNEYHSISTLSTSHYKYNEWLEKVEIGVWALKW
eukprot:scaffold40638_cov42-Cyclotella_meneghiniana.AAC.4